jgi:NAD(P)H-dependent FMN reductase
MNLLIFAGSTRALSFNRRLARAAADLATAAGAQVTLLELADFDIPMYNADLEARGTPPDVLRLKQILHAHTAWVLCCPEYNGSYPALLKNTLDWVSSPVAGDPVWSDGTRAFRGKVVGLLSASPGGHGGLRALSHLTPLMLNLECWVAPRSYALGNAREAFDGQGRLLGDARIAGVQAVLTQTLWAAERLQTIAA